MTTPERSRGRWKYIIFALVVLLLVGTTVAIVSYNPTGSGTHTPTSSAISSSPSSSSSSSSESSSSSSSSRPSYPNGQAYLNASAIYSGLGYPQLTYSGYSPYLPSKPNYTMEYQTQNVSFQVGSVGGDVINLDQAVGLAADYAKLNLSNFSLGAADFNPGEIVNSSLSNDPSWELFFVRTYQGFWTFGSCGNVASSLAANVDALTGRVSESAASYCELTNTSRIPGQFELKVNSSRALQVVRASSVPEVPTALTENGTVISMSPRIVLFGPSSNNAAFQNPLNASLPGRYRLCWVVEMFSPTPQYGYQGTFAVDAETGELVSGWADALYPSMQFESVTGSLNYSSATNLTVSQEVFQIDGGVVGSSGSLPVTVPNVVVVKPGSTASIELNFSINVPRNFNATLSFTNPLPGIESLSQNGVPQGVSFQFEPQALVIPGGGSASTQLLISVDKNAPSGTYLIEVNATAYGPHGAPQGGSEVLFFLSVWDGVGHWPPPPILK